MSLYLLLLFCLFSVTFSARSQNCGKRLLVSSCLSVRLSVWNGSASTGQIFVKFDIRVFKKKSVEKINLNRVTGT